MLDNFKILPALLKKNKYIFYEFKVKREIMIKLTDNKITVILFIFLKLLSWYFQAIP